LALRRRTTLHHNIINIMASSGERVPPKTWQLARLHKKQMSAIILAKGNSGCPYWVSRVRAFGVASDQVVTWMLDDNLDASEFFPFVTAHDIL
jgi:hypothetical protein